jgi:hypothetical protein
MFLYPPRPEKAITPTLISFYERRGWVAQVKKNGTCSLASTNDGDTTFYTRHNEQHKAWTPTEEIINALNRPNTTFIFELLHSKGGGVRNTAYVFDVLVLDGKSLEGVSLKDRLDMLPNLVPQSEGVKIVENHTKNLEGLYRSLTSPLDEGIVLKDPKALLNSCQRDSLNSQWQVKCRRGMKNYSF